MRPYALFAVLIAGALVFALAPVARADDPPKPTDVHPEATSPPPPKGSFEPVPISPSVDVLDHASASVAPLELAEDDNTLVPAAPAGGPLRLSRFDGDRLEIVPDSAGRANELLMRRLAHAGLPSGDVNSAASTSIKVETFESSFSGPWTFLDNNGATGGQHFWNRVACNAAAGSWAGWPAGGGANGVNPCSGANYPDNVDSWLIYGPFSLADAGSAYLDFFFRIESESGFDLLKWMASTDGANFSGFQVSGTYASGPFNNGYNFASFDLADFLGAPNVWIAFHFQSDASMNSRGPFIDDITLRKNTDARTHLTYEDFDVIDFPNQQWESFDADGATNGDYRWDDVMCFARSDGWSMWPADNGANAVDVCAGGQYPNNAWTWLVHGPLNLSGASEAWIDFYFRNDSELDIDYFAWLASKDGANYSGFGISGDYRSGPHVNGYNLLRFDLKDVPDLGDLRGESDVWLAFAFESDASITGQGPFVDDVSVVVERPTGSKTLLPLILKPPPPPTTNLSIKNETTGSVSYTVKIPQGNVTCSGIPAGATRPCGTFTSGTYQVTVNSQQCGTNSGEVNFAPGAVTRAVRCVSN